MQPRFRSVLLLAVFGVSVGNAGMVWLKDLVSPKGWNFGYGLVLRLNESQKGKELPVMDRLTLDVHLGDLIGVSVGKAKSKGAVELDFYVKKHSDRPEGRKRKDNNEEKYIIPLLVGYKGMLLISAMFAILKLLTMKAIILAKAALVVALAALFMKLKGDPHEIIEVEQHHVPYHADNTYGGVAGASNYYHNTGGGMGYASHYYDKGAHQAASTMYQNIVYPTTGVETQVPVQLTEPDSPHSRIGGDIDAQKDARQSKKTRRLITIKKYTATKT